MPPRDYIYKVVIDRKMGIGKTENGMMERLVYYFVDIGSVSFPDKLEKWFAKGRGGKLGTGYKIVSIECLGEAISADED